MNDTMPATLSDAIATEALWLQAWVMLLALVNLASILFIVTRRDGKFGMGIESVAIVLSLAGAGIFMTWLYEQVGYVRLLGLPHLVFWLPVYGWLLKRYLAGRYTFPFKYYLVVYFAVTGLSLVIDAVDVIRYLAGDRAPLHL